MGNATGRLTRKSNKDGVSAEESKDGAAVSSAAGNSEPIFTPEECQELGRQAYETGLPSQLAKAVIPGILRMAESVPYVAPIAGIFMKFYEAYEAVKENSDAYDEMKEEVDYSAKWIEKSRELMCGSAEQHELIDIPLACVSRAVLEVAELSVTLDRRMQDKGLAAAAVKYVLSDLDKRNLAAAIEKLRTTRQNLLQAFSALAGARSLYSNNSSSSTDADLLALLKDACKVPSKEYNAVPNEFKYRGRPVGVGAAESGTFVILALKSPNEILVFQDRNTVVHREKLGSSEPLVLICTEWLSLPVVVVGTIALERVVVYELLDTGILRLLVEFDMEEVVADVLEAESGDGGSLSLAPVQLAICDEELWVATDCEEGDPSLFICKPIVGSDSTIQGAQWSRPASIVSGDFSDWDLRHIRMRTVGDSVWIVPFETTPSNVKVVSRTRYTPVSGHDFAAVSEAMDAVEVSAKQGSAFIYSPDNVLSKMFVSTRGKTARPRVVGRVNVPVTPTGPGYSSTNGNIFWNSHCFCRQMGESTQATEHTIFLAASLEQTMPESVPLRAELFLIQDSHITPLLLKENCKAVQCACTQREAVVICETEEEMSEVLFVDLVPIASSSSSSSSHK